MSENVGVLEEKKPKGISVFSCFLMCAVSTSISIASAYVMTQRMAANSGQPKIVFVDTQKIIDKKAASLSGRDMSPELLAGEAKTFSEKLNDQINKMVLSGNVVINKRAVIGAPNGMDLTAAIAKSVGVVMDDAR